MCLSKGSERHWRTHRPSGMRSKATSFTQRQIEHGFKARKLRISPREGYENRPAPRKANPKLPSEAAPGLPHFKSNSPSFAAKLLAAGRGTLGCLALRRLFARQRRGNIDRLSSRA